MKKHILSIYKTKIAERKTEESTIQTFAVETSDKDNFTYSKGSTRLTERIETSDRN